MVIVAQNVHLLGVYVAKDRVIEDAYHHWHSVTAHEWRAIVQEFHYGIMKSHGLVVGMTWLRRPNRVRKRKNIARLHNGAHTMKVFP